MMLHFDLVGAPGYNSKPLLQPDDIFKKNRSFLIKSLDLKGTTLGEILVEKDLLSSSQLDRIQVKHISKYLLMAFKSLLGAIHCKCFLFIGISNTS